jgi:hypothetical protein
MVKCQKKPAEAGSGCFGYKVSPTSALPSRCKSVESFIVCDYFFCSIVQVVPTLETALDQNLASVFAYRAVHSVTLCPVETMYTPT